MSTKIINIPFKVKDTNNDYLFHSWYGRNIYSSWFKFKDYYNLRIIQSNSETSFGKTSYYTFKHNSNHTDFDESKHYSYGQFHYFFQIDKDFPDPLIANSFLGCATIRDVDHADNNKIYMDSIKVEDTSYWVKENEAWIKKTFTSFPFRDFYFIDLMDVVPSIILTVGVDKNFKAIKRRMNNSSKYEDMKKYYANNRKKLTKKKKKEFFDHVEKGHHYSDLEEIYYILFIESNSELLSVMHV
jgi:hypothetical protein